MNTTSKPTVIITDYWSNVLLDELSETSFDNQQEFLMRRKRIEWSVFLIFSLACAVDGPRGVDSHDNSARSKALQDKSFGQLYAELEEYRKSPAVMISSITSDHNDCEAFREIVRRGDEFLPQIVRKIEEGDFFLNEAMQKITDIDVREVYPGEPVVGEQCVSRLWIRWWNDRDQPSEMGKDPGPASP